MYFNWTFDGNNVINPDKLNDALSNLQNKEGFAATSSAREYFKINIGPDNACLLSTRGGESWLFTSIALTDDSNVSATKLGNAFNKIGGIKGIGTTIYFYCEVWATAFILIELVNYTPIPKILSISASEYNSI